MPQILSSRGLLQSTRWNNLTRIIVSSFLPYTNSQLYYFFEVNSMAKNVNQHHSIFVHKYFYLSHYN